MKQLFELFAIFGFPFEYLDISLYVLFEYLLTGISYWRILAGR
jgi:hypothetical protein